MKVWHYHIFRDTNLGDKAIHQSIQRQVRAVVPGVEFVNRDLNRDVLDAKGIERLNREAAALIIGGSGLYTNFVWKKYRGSHWHFPCDVALYDEIKVPIILWSIGCNQDFEGPMREKPRPETRDAIGRMNRQAVLSSVRDLRTLKFVRDLDSGIDVTLLPDPACLTEPTPSVFMPGSGLNVGINLAMHTAGAVALNKKYLLMVTTALARFRDISNARYWYMRQHKRCELSILALRKKGMCFAGVIGGDPGEMVAAYRQMDFAVGQMMHATILAFAAGTPAVNLAYNTKNEEFYRMISMEDYCLRPSDDMEDRLVSLLDRMSTESKTWRLRLSNTKHLFWQDSMRWLAKVKEVLT